MKDKPNKQKLRVVTLLYILKLPTSVQQLQRLIKHVYKQLKIDYSGVICFCFTRGTMSMIFTAWKHKITIIHLQECQHGCWLPTMTLWLFCQVLHFWQSYRTCWPVLLFWNKYSLAIAILRHGQSLEFIFHIAQPQRTVLVLLLCHMTYGIACMWYYSLKNVYFKNLRHN